MSITDDERSVRGILRAELKKRGVCHTLTDLLEDTHADSVFPAFLAAFELWAEDRAQRCGDAEVERRVREEVARAVVDERNALREKESELDVVIGEAELQNPSLRAAIAEAEKVREYAKDYEERQRAITASGIIISSALGLTHYGISKSNTTEAK